MNTTHKTLELIIPEMISKHCQSRVSNEVKKIEGVEIQNLEAGKLIVLLPSESFKSLVIHAIEKAGYKVSTDGNRKLSNHSAGCCSH